MKGFKPNGESSPRGCLVRVPSRCRGAAGDPRAGACPRGSCQTLAGAPRKALAPSRAARGASQHVVPCITDKATKSNLSRVKVRRKILEFLGSDRVPPHLACQEQLRVSCVTARQSALLVPDLSPGLFHPRTAKSEALSVVTLHRPLASLAAQRLPSAPEGAGTPQRRWVVLPWRWVRWQRLPISVLHFSLLQGGYFPL